MGCINDSSIHPELNQLEYSRTLCPTLSTITILWNSSGMLDKGYKFLLII